jgi:hypothetical protein
MIPQPSFLLIDNRVSGPIDQHLGRHHSGERNRLRAHLQRIGHGQSIRVTWHWNQVFGAEDIGLLQNAAAHLGEGEAMLRGVEALDAPGLLNGLITPQ